MWKTRRSLQVVAVGDPPARPIFVPSQQALLLDLPLFCLQIDFSSIPYWTDLHPRLPLYMICHPLRLRLYVPHYLMLGTHYPCSRSSSRPRAVNTAREQGPTGVIFGHPWTRAVEIGRRYCYDVIIKSTSRTGVQNDTRVHGSRPWTRVERTGVKWRKRVPNSCLKAYDKLQHDDEENKLFTWFSLSLTHGLDVTACSLYILRS